MIKMGEIRGIDVRNCTSKEEICILLKEELNLPEWDENPESLLQLLKDLELPAHPFMAWQGKPYGIFIDGANVVPDNISEYMKNIVDVFNKANDIYDNIIVIVRDEITIDFRNCVTTDEIRDLLKKNLNLPEWDDKKPDALLKILKEFKPCRVYFIGTNLMPDNISGYMKQIIDIFDKVGDMYNNIWTYVMDAVTIDFTGVKRIQDIHELIRVKLDFPDWYGRNLPALNDLLTGYIPCSEIHLRGVKGDDGQIYQDLQQIVEIFQKSETGYNGNKIIIE